MSRRRASSPNLGVAGGVLVFVLLVLAAVFGVDLQGIIDDPGQPVVVSGAGDWYDIYFTDPTCPPEAERRGGLDETLAADIRRAQLQVDIAAFDLDSEPIINALIDREAAGVRVRLVVDDESTPAATVNRLRRNGVSVVEDQRSALMHNKFVVIDGRFVWTGSLNFTSNGAYCNNNNLVRFDLPALAANYRAELSEMYDDRSFGPTSAAATPGEQITVDGVLVENYFASESEVAPILADLIADAQSEIHFLAFSFTNDLIGGAMLDRAADGVAVRGVVETVGAETAFSYYPRLRDAGLPTIAVRRDGNPRIMHHKVIILDRETVIFGSFNFTASANDSNDENVVVVHDPTFAGYFLEEFDAVWAESR